MINNSELNERVLQIESCLACDGTNLVSLIDLGQHPLANEYLQNYKQRESYELKVNRCVSCFHCQLSIAVNPKLMFANYPYTSATSLTMNNFFKNLSRQISLENSNAGKILDIGSNDGSFLMNMDSEDWICLGVDPAINLVSNAYKNGVLNLPTLFNLKTTEILAKDFDVITAFNVFAHNSNPYEMLNAINKITHFESKIYLMTSQAQMIFDNQFDTVYHEHINFFNVKSMKKLLDRVGLFLESVDIVEVHGGSYLWKIVKNRQFHVESEREVYEIQNGLYADEIYLQYNRKVIENRDNVIKIIGSYRKKGFKICLYGSAAKGNTYLNSINLIPDYIFDDTPEKIGKLSPLGDVVVRNPVEIAELEDNVLIIIPAWNFASEIKSS